MRALKIQRYLITGLLTIIPLWVTWLVFSFVLRLLAGLGAPLVAALIGAVHALSPHLAEILDRDWINPALALLLTLLALYVIGWTASRMLGRRLFGWFDDLMARIPLVRTIYDGTKQLMAAMRKKPAGTQRVVLVDFPRVGIKALGFVTRVMPEAGSGREMAAVFVPTAPNPTGGYLLVVPIEELTPTDWTMDQAMAFVISGGAVAPDSVPASRALADGVGLPDLTKS